MCINMGQIEIWRGGGGLALSSDADPDEQRDPRVVEFLKASMAESTRRAYRIFIGKYLRFCAQTQRRELPATAQTLEAFAAYLCKEGLAPASVKVALSAVRRFHNTHVQNPPDRTAANVVVQGHARLRARDGKVDGQGAKAIRLPTLEKLVEACDLATVAGVRDRALLTLGLAMMARRSELAGLDFEDITPVAGGLDVLVRRSKTDQTGRGAKVAIPRWPELQHLCPVTALEAYMAALAPRGITTGPLFRGVDKHGRVNGEPGWTGHGGGRGPGRMDPATLELVIARAAVRARLADAPDLKPHGLRAGGATEAYAAGADILAIARHGRWADRSTVVFQYIRDVDRWARNPMDLVGKGAGVG